MECMSILALILILFLVFVCYRIVVSDCDLVLQITEKFGKSPSTLAGKVVWVTGASSGIGEFTAYEFAKAGCRLVLSARREQELQRVKAECLRVGRVTDEDILVLPLDQLKTETHEAAMGAVLKQFKQIDILLNNAGQAHRGRFSMTSLEVDRQIFEMNVFGGLSLVRNVLSHMMERREGHIVVTSSISGILGLPSSSAYTGAKHALQGYYKSLRVEMVPHNIKVSLVCPGPVFSAVYKHALTEKPGESLGLSMDTGQNRMPTVRCAELISIAIANGIREAWMSPQPFLWMVYLHQYLPWVWHVFIERIGVEMIAKLRDGNLKSTEQHSNSQTTEPH